MQQAANATPLAPGYWSTVQPGWLSSGHAKKAVGLGKQPNPTAI